MNTAALREILVPGWIRAGISFAAALGLVLWFYSEAITQKLAHFAAITPDQLQGQYHSQLRFLEQFSGVKAGTLALFWAGLGVAMYLVSLAAGNSIRSLTNTVVLETQYTKKPPLWRIILLPLIKLTLAMILIALVAFCGLIIIPALLGVGGAVFLHAFSAAALLATLGALLGIALTVYALIVAVQIFFSL